MSKSILYGTDMSGPVRAVILTASAVGLQLDIKELNPQKGETKTAEFLKKNPQHTIPTLEDGGKCIWESHAIVTYLASKYGKNDSLYPKDLYTRAVVDQRLHFDNGVLSPRWYKVVEPLRQGNPMVDESRDSLLEAFGFLETFLGNNSYMVGNSVTVADFSIVANMSTIAILFPIDAVKFPKITAWQKRMAALPYYEKANGVGLKKCEVYIKNMVAEAAKK